MNKENETEGPEGFPIENLRARKQQQATPALDLARHLARLGGWTLDATTQSVELDTESALVFDLQPETAYPISQIGSLCQGEFYEIFTSAWQSAIEQSQSFTLDLELTTARGMQKWVRMIGLPVVANTGVTRLEGSVQDITELHACHILTNRQESLFESFFQVIPDLYFLIDRTGVILEYRVHQQTNLFVTPEAVLKHKISDLLPPSAARQFAVSLDKALATGEMTSFEYSQDQSAGGHYECRLSQVAGKQQCIATIRDITERKQLEIESRERMKELSCLYEVSRLIDHPDITEVQLCETICALLPRAMMYPDAATSVMTYVGSRCQSGPAIGPLDHCLGSTISVDGQDIGRLEIHYPRPCEFLLPFEQTLIDNLASLLSIRAQRKSAEILLSQERELLSATLKSIDEGIIVTDRSGRITLMNPMAERLSQYPRDAATGKELDDVFQCFHSVSRARLANPVRTVLTAGLNGEIAKETVLRQMGGADIYIAGNTAAIRASDGEISGAVLSFRDISKEYTQEKEIEGFLNVNLEMLCVTDLAGNFHKVNKRFEAVLGYTADELAGKSFLSLIHDDDLLVFLTALQEMMANQSLCSITNRYRCKDGSFKYIEWHMQPKIGQFAYLSARDVTEKRLLEERLRKIAIRDELTGLYNRNYFETIIGDEMDQADRYGSPLSMLLLDLDYFKQVNDTWGHPAGDDLLKQTAQIIERSIRGTDILVRFGGEELVIVLPQTALDGAVAAAEKIRAAKAMSHHPVTGTQTVSIGVAERMKSESLRHWYRRVDEALYRAKESGRNCVVSSDDQDNLPIASARIEWQSEWESGNKEIDQQHLVMIEIANRLINMSFAGSDYQATLHQLDLLLNHIVRHFGYEEKILANIGYPDLPSHSDIHRSLVTKALRLKDSYINGEIRASAFFSFMIDDVILGHLQDVDTRFFAYFRKGRELNPQ